MESRLPKPKVVLKGSVSTSMSTKMENSKMIKNQSTIQPLESANQVPARPVKSKTTLHMNTKFANENKPPSKPVLTRSKTTLSITTRAMKRPATTAPAHAEVKKPFTKSVAGQTAQKTKVLTSNNINKGAQSAAGKKPISTAVAKPSKWDLKGQLAHKSDELTSIRQKYKEAASMVDELQDQVNTLGASVTEYKLKAETYESVNKVLDSKVKDLSTDLSNTQEERDSLAKRLKVSDEALQETQEKCASQKMLLSKSTLEVENLKGIVEVNKILIAELTTERDELRALVHTMDKDRRILHNTIQEMKGNIRVFCRVRPRTQSELGKPTCTMNFIDECTIDVGKSDGSDSVSCSGKLRGTRQEFSFDKVFPPTATQETIFEELALLVQSALEGYNVCVFAYGQTGSGKTYTMEGIPGLETEGMIPRTVRHIFNEMKQFQLLGWEYRIEASFLEIYNEHIVDLLDAQQKTHEIRMADSKGHDLYVSNLRIEEIHNPEELHECLLIAQRNRAVAATQSNERSSRSHSVARIKLIGVHKEKEEVSIGNLNLVDLAGSERLKGEESARVTETKNINKSLANLGNVILALLKKQEHIPYRNSKLTHLLMPSLGGNSKTLMLLNVSPLDECYNETLNSLRFASNVNSCKTGNVKRTRTLLQTS